MLESMADDIPQLSAETFAALQEFYREQDKKRVEELHTDSVEENWVWLFNTADAFMLVYMYMLIKKTMASYL